MRRSRVSSSVLERSWAFLGVLGRFDSAEMSVGRKRAWGSFEHPRSLIERWWATVACEDARAVASYGATRGVQQIPRSIPHFRRDALVR